METAARAATLTLLGGVVERRFHARRADLAGTVQACACGQSVRFKGHCRKTFWTALGAITLQRAYSYCAACEHDFHPHDRALQREGGSLSPWLTCLIGTTAVQVSFAAASGLLVELAGLQVPPRLVECTAQALGAAIAVEERTGIEPEPARAPTAYLGRDGSGVPMRSAETVGRLGKPADGRAQSHECKLVTCWTAETRTPEGRPQRGALLGGGRERHGPPRCPVSLARSPDGGTLQLGGSRAARRLGGWRALDLESRFQRLSRGDLGSVRRADASRGPRPSTRPNFRWPLRFEVHARIGVSVKMP